MQERTRRILSHLYYAIILLSITLALASSCNPKNESKRKALDELDSHIQDAVAAEEFSGTVLLAKGGKSFFIKAYGYASMGFEVPNKVDTKFNLGSMNKMFTTIAIGQLAEAGKLFYENPIGLYLGEDWVSIEMGKKVKISHLLTHTAGFGSFFNKIFWNSPRDWFKAVDDYKVLVQGEGLLFDPGTMWSYSNTGFVLLGAIVEKVSGADYFDYVRDHVFKPAGMVNTDSYDMEIPVPNLAIGYGKIEGKDGKVHWENNLFKHQIKGNPAGGGFSTVEDLLKFDIALRSNTLINGETWKLLTTVQPNTGTGRNKWGYGFIIREDEQLGKVVGHGGGFFGINSVLDMYMDTGYSVVVMSNYSDGVGAVEDKIREVLITLKN